MKDPVKTRESLLNVRAAIQENSGRLQYSHYARPGKAGAPDTIGELATDCGTFGCVSGWAHAVLKPEAPFDSVGFGSGMKLLGLSYEDADFLFYCEKGRGLSRVNHSVLSRERGYGEAIKRIDILVEACSDQIEGRSAIGKLMRKIKGLFSKR